MSRVEPKVELLSYTPEPEMTVAMAAKLCYSSSHISDLADTDSESQAKFIKRLMSMGHLSPIEHASFTFGIEGVSRSFLAQITRHRIASFSVQSQRYVGQSKEGGVMNYILPPSIEALGEEAVAEYEKQMETMSRWYAEWIEKLGGKSQSANEDARFVLPNACETRMVMTMNARELLHFLALRCCRRAQWEIREVAWQMLELVYPVAPSIFSKAGPGCVSKGCPEGRFTCGDPSWAREKLAGIKAKTDKTE